jgi:hypothetical protein
MPAAGKFAGSSYIKLEDLKNKPPLRERISFVKEEDGKYGAKLVLFFESGKKLSLNTTSVGNLIRDISEDCDDWPRHDFEVFAGEVDFQNGQANAVLVQLITGKKRKAFIPEFDDPIPYK